MNVDLIPIKNFIKLNNLQEVTNPILFEKGFIPTSEGILSTEIFGVTTKDRKDTYAFISLNGHFLQPFIYKMLKRMNRNFEALINGTKNFIIEDGTLKEDENGKTGLEFLYSNWSKLKFEKNESRMRNERIDLLTASHVDEIFTEYWIVIPPFYRDVNVQSGTRSGGSEKINNFYTRLLRNAIMLKNSNNFDFVLESTRGKMQQTLEEVYDHLKGKIEKKQGLIKSSLLGKSIDYGARLVISAPRFNTNRYEDMPINLYYTGLPLANCCSVFMPFIVAWIRNYMVKQLESIGNKIRTVLPNGDFVYTKLKDPQIYFSEDFIKKQIDKFVFSYADRFEKVVLPIEESDIGAVESRTPFLSFAGYENSTDEIEGRTPLTDRAATWCDILYRAAYDVTANMHVYVTRYPVLDYFGSFPSRITVLSTHETVPMFINGTLYKNYPKIDFSMSKEQISTAFIDTLVMSNLYLAGLGGDLTYMVPMLEIA